jgi:hypothetical protein
LEVREELRWASIEGVGPPPPAQKSMKTYECTRVESWEARTRAAREAGEEVWKKGTWRTAC